MADGTHAKTRRHTASDADERAGVVAGKRRKRCHAGCGAGTQRRTPRVDLSPLSRRSGPAGRKQLLHDSDYRAGCPVVALVIDGQERIPEAAELTRQVFGRMTTEMVRILRDAGASEGHAHSMATVAIAALEGAVILCRVQQSTQPLDDVAALLESQLAMQA